MNRYYAFTDYWQLEDIGEHVTRDNAVKEACKRFGDRFYCIFDTDYDVEWMHDQLRDRLVCGAEYRDMEQAAFDLVAEAEAIDIQDDHVILKVKREDFDRVAKLGHGWHNMGERT